MKRLTLGGLLFVMATPVFAAPATSQLWSKLSYCAGFTQAIAIDQTGSIENFADLWTTGNVTDASVSAGIEYNQFKQAAFNVKGYLDDDAFNKGGMQAGDYIMTGHMKTKGRMELRECRSLPKPSLQPGVEIGVRHFDIVNDGNQCVKVLEYSAGNSNNPNERKDWRTQALELRAWLVQNNYYHEDRVSAGLKDLSTNVSVNLDDSRLAKDLVQTRKACTNMVKENE